MYVVKIDTSMYMICFQHPKLISIDCKIFSRKKIVCSYTNILLLKILTQCKIKIELKVKIHNNNNKFTSGVTDLQIIFFLYFMFTID